MFRDTVRHRSGRAAASALAATAAVATAVALAGPASAAAAPVPVVTDLVTPLTLSVSGNHIYVTQNFVSLLTRFNGDGSGRTDLLKRNGDNIEIGGVEAKGPGTLFTVTGKTFAKLVWMSDSGKKHAIGKLYAYEHTVNPDRKQTYGFQDLTADCASQVPAEVGGGAPQPAIKDSHPYGVARGSNGVVYVADAAGNDVLAVWPNGKISTVAVLPPQPVTITAEVATGFGLPDCTVGHDYLFEPVPTDVEVHNGWLYVSTLPGGPEGPELGARGSVYRINPHTGRTVLVGTGLLGATGVAVSPSGAVYAAELFGGKISQLVNGAPVTVAELEAPAAVEWAHGKLYATSGALPPASGQVVTITP